MAGDRTFADAVAGRLVPLGPVVARRMFGGFGVFVEGLMFGLIAGDTLYFKVDDGNRGDYHAAGAAPFTYQRRGKSVSMSYHEVPARVFGDGEALIEWAERALRAARRNKAARRRKAPRAA